MTPKTGPQLWQAGVQTRVRHGKYCMPAPPRLYPHNTEEAGGDRKQLYFQKCPPASSAKFEGIDKIITIMLATASQEYRPLISKI